MAWTNDNILEFIRLYRNERILWDPKHPQCKNRSVTSDAWMRIQSCLSVRGCTIKDLKKKKESLMTSFRFHWTRKKKNPHYRTAWFAYDAMEEFLVEKYSPDNTNELENEFFNTTDQSYVSDPISCHNVVETEKNNSKQSISTTYVSKKPIKHRPSEDLIRLSCSNNNDTSRSLDEYDLYGQLLVTKLRKLDEQQRDVAMHEIDNIMFRAKMQSGAQIKNLSSSSSPVHRKMKSPIFIVTQQNNVEYEDENIVYPEHVQSQQPS